jgi:hypothetical protein
MNTFSLGLLPYPKRQKIPVRICVLRDDDILPVQELSHFGELSSKGETPRERSGFF